MSFLAPLFDGGMAYRTARFNAEMAENQSRVERGRIAYENARIADKKGQREKSLSQQIGQTRSGYAASGVRLEGTPIEVLEETLRIGEEDLSALDKQIRLNDWKARYATWEGDARARQYRAQGNSQLAAGVIRAGSSMMTQGYFK